MKGLSKAESLDRLESLGLNTVDRLVLRKDLGHEITLSTIGELATEAFGKWSMVSMRTWRKNGIVCPFAPNQNSVSLAKYIANNLETIQNCDEMIFAEGIDPAKSLYCGRVSQMQDMNLIMEYFKGAGTVRDLDSKHLGEVFRFTVPFGKTVTVGWREIIAPANNVFRSYPQSTIEWSIYPYHIGKLRQHSIFWEII